MKKILLIGAKGNLGSAIIRSRLFKNISTPDKKKLNLLKKKNIKNFLSKKFDIIINCSGYPRIKNCEENVLKSFELNYLTVKNLVEEIRLYNLRKKQNIRLIHISTDAVYESLHGNYIETDEYCPKNVYAVCKVLAEAQVKYLKNFCIIRTRFYDKRKLLYKDSAVDIFSSMLEIEKLAKIIFKLSFQRVNGILNVGEKRKSDYNFLKKYHKKLKKISRKKIQKKLTYFITKDASLNLKKFYNLKISV